jgi:hypothetical protein
MTVADAYNHLDLLLDKADQPYFTNSEKDIFLQLAVTEFVNQYYKGYGLNQEYRDSLLGFTTYATAVLSSTSKGKFYPSSAFVHLISLQANNKDYKIVSVGDYLNIVDMANQNLISKDPFHDTKNEPIATVSGYGGGATEIRFFPYDPNGENAEYHYIQEKTLVDLFDNDKLALKDQHQVLKIATRMLTANIESSNYEVQVKETE